MTAFVKRRELLLGFAALPVASHIAVAETYPSRPVRILVATSAGGGTDLVARFIAQWLSERLGQSFFVENRPGGGNNIGTEMAAHSPADGYTLFMANTVNAINNSLYQNLNYNFIADFAPIANVMGTPLLVLVHPSVEAKSVAELIALAKASPGKLNLASGGVGSTGHMSAELFQMMAGIKFTHVPYRGEALALIDLIAGQAQVMISTTGSSLQSLARGRAPRHCQPDRRLRRRSSCIEGQMRRARWIRRRRQSQYRRERVCRRLPREVWCPARCRRTRWPPVHL